MIEYLTVREVALIFRLRKDDTIREWIKQGVFPNAIKRDGYLIPQSDVDDLIDKSRLAGVCPPPRFIKTPATVKKAKTGFVTRWKP